MKVKNIKAGVRVVSKVNYWGVRIGDVGTVIEAGRVSFVQWDRADANCTTYKGIPCTVLQHLELSTYTG